MRAILFLFSYLLIVGAAWSKNAENYYFRHYTNKDGLSHNTVYCSLQDKKGFMWFGTDDGLNRFDSYSFQVFRYNSRSNTENQLLHNRIISLFEDSSGKIWICTNAGVCWYDYETDAFHPFRLVEQAATPYYADQIAEDNNGNLWFRAYSRITRYNPESKDFRVYPSEESGFHSVTMTMTEKGTPVFADASSLFTFNPDNEKFNKITSLESCLKNNLTVIRTLFEIPQTGYFIGTDLEGLLLYRPETSDTETIIPDIYVRTIIPYTAGTYWIASESGIYIYNLLDKSIVNIRKSLTNEYTIADNAAYSLTKDREGGIWIGSFFGGINYLPKNHNHFTYYIGGKTHTGMLGNTVREIVPDQYGNLWLGTEDNGINCFNPKDNTMVNYSLLNTERKLTATNIHGLFADGDTLWVGTFNKGIELLDIPTGKVIKQYTQSNTNNGLISNFILSFLKTKRGDFLVGTSGGVVAFDKKRNSFSRWKGINGLVRQFLEDKEGNIWTATDNGLYKYIPAHTGADGKKKEEEVSRYTSDPASGGQGLGSSNTTSVFEDSKGRIWVTTVYGFSLYNKETDSFNRITTEDGLPSNIIYRIVEDDDELFWISTANGLVKFNPQTYVMQTFTYTDGLHETQFNFSSSYKSPEGRIYMGTINGMISFHPRNFTKDSYTPPLFITRIQVADSPDKNTYLLNNNPDNPYILQLPYNSATFTVSYIAPGYTSPDAVKYSYMLEGSDNEWVNMGRNKEVTFANLAPGKYTFKVRSTNSNDTWQNNEQVMQIVITPPFWATGWAFAFYGLLLIGIVILFYRYKKQKFFRKVQRSQELFEAEKEKELYDAKIQFFTFITHEIRTPLTLIKAPLEKVMKLNEGSEKTRQNLQVIEKNTQRLLDLSNQLLDFRKTESRGFRLNFVKTNVSVVLENILTPFYTIFRNEGKNFSAHLPEKHVFAYIDRNAFTKIVTNLLTNALKYATDRIDLQMTASDEVNQTFSITIVNNGFLIPEEESENIFTPFYRLEETQNRQGSGIGLSLSRTLAEFHHGTLVFHATEDGLNQFTLTLPVKQNDYSFDLMEESVQPDPAAKTVAADTGSKPVLLVVEDQPDMRKFIVDEISATYKVLEAENGKEALELLGNNMVHLIISDIMMPVMDGFELCDKVKNDVQFSHIPFILLTAQHNLQSRVTGLNQGADAYMEKPFSLEHLSAQIENLLRNREILRKAYVEKPLTSTQSLASSPVDDRFLQKLNAYILENLTNEHLSVEMIAGNMNMSNSSLYRKVKGISGISPVDFIRIIRLKKAVELMHSGEKRINEIAFATGFSSPAYFSTSFQKQYGKSPSEFMKELG
ncbi:MAG: response regulator [Tannerella sp.]|jgi:signal transduction histidine kinase/ligand-binding sensor domain-containing protein/DNA-binding response OmpR family regulator|nr:response regulator [Tannerella sp.]